MKESEEFCLSILQKHPQKPSKPPGCAGGSMQNNPFWMGMPFLHKDSERFMFLHYSSVYSCLSSVMTEERESGELL